MQNEKIVHLRFESPRQLQRNRGVWKVTAGLNGVNRLTRDSNQPGKLSHGDAAPFAQAS